MKIESVVARVARPEPRGVGGAGQRVAAAADTGAGLGTERDPALH